MYMVEGFISGTFVSMNYLVQYALYYLFYKGKGKGRHTQFPESNCQDCIIFH